MFQKIGMAEGNEPTQAGAIRSRLGELAPRNRRRLIVHDGLDVGRDLFAVGFGRCLGEGLHQRRDPLVALPAGEVDAVERHHDIGQR